MRGGEAATSDKYCSHTTGPTGIWPNLFSHQETGTHSRTLYWVVRGQRKKPALSDAWLSPAGHTGNVPNLGTCPGACAAGPARGQDMEHLPRPLTPCPPQWVASCGPGGLPPSWPPLPFPATSGWGCTCYSVTLANEIILAKLS